MISWRRVPRRPLALALGAGALAALSGKSPEPGLDGLARALASATPHEGEEGADASTGPSASVVAPEDIRWAPSNGAFEDAVLGRPVLYLARREKDAPRDVYRALARVTPEGTVLSIGRVRNLSKTPLGDDHALVMSGSLAAYATFAFGAEQSVTVLDLAGEGAQNVTTRLHDRAMAIVTNVQETGAREGVARYSLSFTSPAKRVGIAIVDQKVTIEVDDGKVHTAVFDPAHAEAAESAGLRVLPGRHLPKPVVFWAVDTVRAVPWIGPKPIAWLEDRVFLVKDVIKRKAHGSPSGATLVETEPASAALEADGGEDGGFWPPGPIHPIFKPPKAGEGAWVPPNPKWMKRLAAPEGAGEVPPAFLVSFVRPDPEREYAEVMFVAMDMRQLELRMEAGVEDPEPLVGPKGTGRIPRDTKIASRVVAAFNGGFKTEHGSYGMMVDKRVLLPPQPGAASVVTLKDGRVGLGSWGNTREVSGIKDVDDDEIVSFRQNLDPLLDGDKLNPTGRALWGFTLPGTSVQTERTGVCVTQAGHLIYAWGEDVSATTLSRGMKMAGCIYAMHLDMNPHHTGLVFANITELKGRQYKSELLSPKMGIAPDRYIEYAPKDFFYMLLREPKPPAIGNVVFGPDGGTQPLPAWQPALFSARSDDADLVLVTNGRASFRLRPGFREPDLKMGGAAETELAPADKKRVLFAAGLGVARDKALHGLAIDGKTVLPFEGGAGFGTLEVSPEGALSIATGREKSEILPHADRVELPVLFDGENQGPSALAQGARLAIGVTATGQVFLARGTSEAMRAALARGGCVRALAFARGTTGETYHRTGTEAAPRSRYPETVLYGLGLPMHPTAFRFDPKNPVPIPTKK